MTSARESCCKDTRLLLLSHAVRSTVIVHTFRSAGLTRKSFNVAFYEEIHNKAFTTDASKLNKRNGFRKDDSWIYLPMPDKVSRPDAGVLR